MAALSVKEAAEKYLNMNYLGMIAGVLSIIVTAYNINKYYETVRKEK